MKNFDDVIHRFRGVKETQTPGKYVAFCPLHGNGCERRRSLVILVREQFVWVHCSVCDSSVKAQLLQQVGLTMSDLFAREEETGDPWKEHKRPRIDQTFDYTNEKGEVLYRVLRWNPKGFSQERLDGDKFIPGLADSRRVLYKLHLMDQCPQSMTLTVHEGERKADLVWSWGVPATCCVGGAGMGWRDDYSRWIVQRFESVLVVPDNDAKGREHADRVVGSLLRHGITSVGLLDLPNLPEKGDVVDWHKAGGDGQKFMRLVHMAKLYRSRK